jgi:hypothetical protein
MDVFLPWYVHEMPGREEDSKTIGVYASAKDAEAARLRGLLQLGFRDSADGCDHRLAAHV